MSVSALILAGGNSIRFGSDKSFADLGGTPLIEHIISQLMPHFDEIIISANNKADYAYLNRQIVGDIFTGAGPIAGLHAGLKAASGDYVFLAACDMPFVSDALIKRMRRVLAEMTPAAAVPKREGFIEPFHGFYSAGLAPEIEKKLEEGGCGLYSFLTGISPETVDWADDRPFYNINSAEDLQKIMLLMK